MRPAESNALKKAGVTMGKIKYYDATEASLSWSFLRKHDWKTWPDLPDVIQHETATNTSIISYKGKKLGLTHFADNNSLSVSLSHPLSKFWLSILQPVWDRQNEGKCKTCHGTGWDGIGYVLTCVDCGGNGKEKPEATVSK